MALSSLYFAFLHSLLFYIVTTLPHWTCPSVFSGMIPFYKSSGIALQFVFPENPSSLIHSAICLRVFSHDTSACHRFPGGDLLLCYLVKRWCCKVTWSFSSIPAAQFQEAQCCSEKCLLICFFFFFTQQRQWKCSRKTNNHIKGKFLSSSPSPSRHTPIQKCTETKERNGSYTHKA